MFFKRKKKADKTLPGGGAMSAGPAGETVLRPGWHFTGRIYGKGQVVIQSAVEGELDLQGTVSIEGQGRIKGMLRAEEVRLSGRFEGRMEAARRVVLEATARMEGDVVARRLQMAAGARLNGQVDMQSLTQSFKEHAT